MWWTIIISVALVVGIYIYVTSEVEVRKRAIQNIIDDAKSEQDEDEED